MRLVNLEKDGIAFGSKSLALISDLAAYECCCLGHELNKPHIDNMTFTHAGFS